LSGFVVKLIRKDVGIVGRKTAWTKICFIKASGILHAVNKTRKAAVKVINTFISSHSTPLTEGQLVQECLTETVKIMVHKKVKHIKH
jgi:hypothetical protein